MDDFSQWIDTGRVLKLPVMQTRYRNAVIYPKITRNLHVITRNDHLVLQSDI